MKAVIIISIAFLLIICGNPPGALAQNKKCESGYDVKLKREVYTTIDEAPEFPDDGIQGFNKFIIKHLKYPEQETFQGYIKYSFTVDETGDLLDIKIEDKTIGEYSPVDKEMIKVLSRSPKWKPGRCNGKKVCFREIFLLHF